MPKGRAINQLASEQGGIILRTQAIAAGMATSTIDRRVSSGTWWTVRPGVYRLFESRGETDDLRAAVTALPNAVVSHFSAGRMHGLGAFKHDPTTVVVHSTTTHSFPGVVVVRCHDLDDVDVLELTALRATSVDRTLVDLAGRLTLGSLARVLDDALVAGSATIGSVGSVLERVARRGKPGIRNLRALLVEREGLDFSRSLLEARGEELLRSAGFVGWEREFPVPWDHRLRFDIGFPRHRVAIEWDSVRWHADRGAFQSDRARDRAAATLGWTVLRFTWTDVVTNPLHVIDDVRLVLSRRST